MKMGQHRFLSLMSMMTALWTLGHGCPNEPGPTCDEELPNTVAIINRLKKSLEDLYKSFVDGGYGGRELRGPVCIPSISGTRDQSMDLDTTETRLCQYAKCFQNLAQTVKENPDISQTSFDFCQKYLNQLINATKKMKKQPPALCMTHCRISWSNASNWEEITKGPRLTQELLTYLEGLPVPCSRGN